MPLSWLWRLKAAMEELHQEWAGNSSLWSIQLDYDEMNDGANIGWLVC